MTQRNVNVNQVAGISSRCGKPRLARYNDGLPSKAELRELAQRLGGNSRRCRCGRPGRINSPHEWERVLSKLRAAARRGRGLRYLSRDELDTLLGGLARLKPAKPAQPASHKGK